MTASDSGVRKPGSTRRQFLLGGAVAGVAAAAAVGIDYALNSTPTAAPTPAGEPVVHGGESVAFYGAHQAGIATDAQAHGTFVALDLKPETDRDALRRLMRILTDDAARLTAGKPALADSEPEMALTPARLTVTFGFGPGLCRERGVPVCSSCLRSESTASSPSSVRVTCCCRWPVTTRRRLRTRRACC